VVDALPRLADVFAVQELSIGTLADHGLGRAPRGAAV